jgi:DNA-binding NarL/FixJ family response regulator
MSDEDAFDHRIVRGAEAYSRLYPSIIPRLKAAIRSGHPAARAIAAAVARSLEESVGRQQAQLQDQHGLSRQEIKVALHLIEGGTVATCAATLDVAESTVRSHLKSIFAKTGVNRQADLHRLLGPRPTP